ncbi:Proteasome activator pa28 beta subunit [Spironucleus salmonicida]|uniref:Proteasome activator pa28 beta subunit n=1 Tax=Spironucleus salmonicida TaxID=348837 RepID=V6LLE2_9EUKA|nr:Proteasome activator pa28 beta subunit [Spironucleus salmonicida]|eukprot:EST44566.1 Proteasome activator pa28 beta subunit [Spironucleus salmonicida]
MSKVQLPPAAAELREQMKKRSLVYEQQAEKTIYVDMPSKAMEFDQLLKTHPFLQSSFAEEIQNKYKILLKFDSSNLPNIDLITATLSLPPTQFVEVEDFLRDRISSVLELVSKIMLWVYSLQTINNENEDSSDKIQEALVQVEDNCNSVVDSLLQYHQTRGKLLAKLQKRRLFDVAKTLAQFDIAHAQDVKNGFIDLYNTVIGAYDSCIQSFEGIRGGRQRGTAGFQGMF